MKSQHILSSIILASPLFTNGVGLAQTTPKKNILFIAVDDLKPLLGCYGDPLAKTPNIDRLASRGAIYTQSYCQQAVSAPTRASLLTGKCPDYTKVWDLQTLIRDMNPNIVTFPQYIRSKGYSTAGIGKIFDPRSVDASQDALSWSVPYIKESSFMDNSTGPIVNNYFRSAETRAQAAVLTSEGKALGLTGTALTEYVLKLLMPSSECIDINDEAYSDGAIAKGAVDFLTKQDITKPFFLAVGFRRPHLPFVAPKKYWDLYNRDLMPLAQYRKKALNSTDLGYHNSGELQSYTDIPPLYTFSDINNTILPDSKAKELIHGYYASISYMDAQLGKVLDKLDSKGLTSNTVIVLWGDHGWHLGDHGLWNKHSNFEQATRAPLIIVDPAVNKAVTVNSPVEFLDIFPTLCNLVDVEIPANLDGKSLKTTLTDPNTSVKDYAVSQYPRSTNMGYSIRTQKYRYTVWVPWTNKISKFDKIVAEELYDYENDPLETENLVAKASYASILTTMKAHFAEFKAKRVQTSTVIPNLKSFRVFPNPASNEISMEGLQPNSIISVFDMTGKMLIRKTTNDNISKISLSELANGTYLVKANSHVEKLIICK